MIIRQKTRRVDPPEDCYICGGPKHPDNNDHNYWSNADADAWFDAQPEPDYSPEAAYVAKYRPY